MCEGNGTKNVENFSPFMQVRAFQVSSKKDPGPLGLCLSLITIIQLKCFMFISLCLYNQTEPLGIDPWDCTSVRFLQKIIRAPQNFSLNILFFQFKYFVCFIFTLNTCIGILWSSGQISCIRRLCQILYTPVIYFQYTKYPAKFCIRSLCFIFPLTVCYI